MAGFDAPNSSSSPFETRPSVSDLSETDTSESPSLAGQTWAGAPQDEDEEEYGPSPVAGGRGMRVERFVPLSQASLRRHSIHAHQIRHSRSHIGIRRQLNAGGAHAIGFWINAHQRFAIGVIAQRLQQ